MSNLQQNLSNGFNILNKNTLLFFSICLISSVISVYLIPSWIKNSLSEQEIDQQINSLDYGGATVFSPDQIVLSLIYIFRFLLISTVLLIIAYIVKNIVDKRLFNIGNWRDWKFFLYISAVTFLEIYVFEGLLGSAKVDAQNNIIASLLLIMTYCVITVAFSAILLPTADKK